MAAAITASLGACARSEDGQTGGASAAVAPDTAARSAKLVDITPLTDVNDAAQIAAIANAVRNAGIDATEFKKTAGDAQPVSTVYARVHPHKDAHKGQDLLTNLPLDKAKVLARIIATDPVVLSGVTIPADTTIWVVVRSSGTLYGIFVPMGGGTAAVKELERTPHPGDAHEGAKSRWVVKIPPLALTTEYGVWTTCDGEGCCCTGSSCDAAID